MGRVARTAETAANAAASIDLAGIPADFPDVLDSASLRALRESLSIEDDAETTVHVYRVNPETKGDAKIWDGDASGFNLATLAKVFGSGQYRVKVYMRTPDGFKPLRYNRVQEWELSPEDEARVQAARLAAKNPILPAMPKQEINTAEVIERMMAGFQQSTAQMLAALKPETAADPMQQLKLLAELMRTMAPPAQPAPPDQFTQLSAMLGMMEKLKNITKSDIPEGASVTDTLLLRAAESFMPAVAQGLVKQPAPVEQPAQVQRVLPAPAASNAPLAASELTEEQELMKATEMLKLAKFKAALAVANKNAARGVNPQDYAEDMYELLDEADIIEIATAADWFATLVQIAPGCEPHREWYAAVRAAIVDFAVEDGLLVRDASGALTVPADTGITEGTPSTGGAPLGTAGADTGAAQK